MINALEQKGIARSLAEPNLVALSGDTASFLARRRIPNSGRRVASWSVTVDYKKYGVGLCLHADRAWCGAWSTCSIEPGSQPDRHDPYGDSAVTASRVPALIVRRASTTVELRDGQSFVIGGLLQSDGKNAIEQLPWLGSVPVLGVCSPAKSYREERDRSCHHCHAAHRASGAARATRSRRRPTTRCRRMTSTSSCSGRPKSRVNRRRAADTQDGPNRGRRGARRSPVTCSICRRGNPMRPFSKAMRPLAACHRACRSWRLLGIS